MRDDFRFEDEQFSFQPEFDPEADLEFPGQGLEAEAFDQETPVTTRQTSPRPPATARPASPIGCRILWPALGFPSVIAPRSGSAGKPFDSDATRCICVLLLSDKSNLTAEDVARYLRYTQWINRRQRTIKAGDPGSFSPRELSVRRVSTSRPADKNGDALSFGANPSGQNGVIVSLSNYVIRRYREWKLAFLYEVRVSEEASARIADGLYHIFWNKEEQDNNESSNEMNVLVDRFARRRREEELGSSWRSWMPFLMKEYKFEYGGLHPPYNKHEKGNVPTEVLHPLFVQRKLRTDLRIGHVTDTHVDVRNDVYERNLQRDYKGKKPLDFNNWNKSFRSVYDDCKNRSDVILLTGDLIDYGRGHLGREDADDKLARDDHYHKDRNWFLFYYFLASRDCYKVPVYTTLGNHDWRLNPYPPFAPSTPYPEEFIHNNNDKDPNNKDRNFTKPEQDQLLRLAHGKGHNLAYSYALGVEKGFFQMAKAAARAIQRDPAGAWQALKGNLDIKGSPVNTDVESIAWYLMLINPFLDYQFALPTGHQFLMLDFAEDEELQKEDLNTHRGYGPRAGRCLTPIQQWHVSIFTKPSGRAKTIGIHNPPIGPRPDWYVGDLLSGVKKWEWGKSGYSHRYDLPNGKMVEIREHLLYAFRPKQKDERGFDNAPYGIAADYGSFMGKYTKGIESREWFIRKVADPAAGIRAVFSGHIHREGFFVVQRQPPNSDVFTIRAVPGSTVNNMRPPGAAVFPAGNMRPGPLYVNTTSGGPRGYQYHGRDNYRSEDPGFSVLTMANDGTLIGVQHATPQRRPAALAAGAR
jgi:hypothetical protein